MVYFTVLLIFLLITTAIWFVGVAIYQSLLGGPDLRHNPDFVWSTCLSILLVSVISFVPFPWCYYFSLGAWALAARLMLALPLSKAVALFLILAALSFISRLAILGALSL